MGFHINVWNMPRIESYENAKREFESRTVVRGGDQSIRRIGDRHEKEKWLRKDMLDGIEVYTAGYYNTDLVRFYPTHKEITLGGYPSTSTQYFVERIAGVGLYPFEHKKYVPSPFTRSPLVANGDIECNISVKGEFKCIDAYSWYKLDYDNYPLNEEQFIVPKRYKVDNALMRELRKPYKYLIKYIDTILKLNSDGFENDEKLSVQIPKTDAELLEFMKQESNVYLSYYYLIRMTAHRVWYDDNKKYHVTIGMVKRFLDKKLKLQNPEVLIAVN